MARMTMRTREAPMEWEREHDQGRPNIFATAIPLPLESDQGVQGVQGSSTSPMLKQRSSAFSSFSSDQGGHGNGHPVQRESSIASQKSDSSFSSGGWGSTMPKPFHQDSQVLSASGTSTSRQGTFGFAGSRPQSPSGSPLSNMKQQQTEGRHDDSETSSRDNKKTRASLGKATSFDMGSLRNDVLDHEQRPRTRSPPGRDFSSGSDMQSKTANRSGLQYRSHTAPSTFWSDDDGDDDDSRRQENHDMGGSEEDEDRDLHRNKSWNSPHDRQRGAQSQSRGQESSLRRETGRPSRSQPPSSKTRHQSPGRIWSENVDLPFIMSGYVQVAMNTVFVCVLIYIVSNIIMTVQSDITSRTESYLQREIREIENCKMEYFDLYRCHEKIGSALFTKCENLKECKERPTPRIVRSTVAAETFAHIFNSFVNAMSYKTMAFMIVLVFGGLYFSNHAISSYRSNHVMHHQHSILPPTGGSKSDSRPMISNGSRRLNNNYDYDDTSKTVTGTGALVSPGSRDGSGLALSRRENSFGGGGGYGSSLQLSRGGGFGMQRIGSRLNQDEDQDIDMGN